MHGIQPGPLLYRDHIEVVYMIFAGLMVCNIVMLMCGLLGIRLFAKIISINRNILLPVIFVLAVVGSYSMRNSLFDVWITLLLGLFGYLMLRGGFPMAPTVLGLVLGPMLESEIRRSLILSAGDWSVFFVRPISVLFIGLSLLIALTVAVKSFKKGKKAEQVGVSV